MAEATNQPEKPESSKTKAPETPTTIPQSTQSPPSPVTSAPQWTGNTSLDPSKEPVIQEDPKKPTEDPPPIPSPPTETGSAGADTPDPAVTQTANSGDQNPPEEEKSELEKLREKNEADAKDKTELKAEARVTAAEEAKKPTPQSNRFDGTKLIHKNDADFLAVAEICVPKEPESWVHPTNDHIMFAYGLAQMVVNKDLDLRKASREVVLEWIYVRTWRPLSLGSLCKNIEAASAILKLFMIMPRRMATQIIQNTIINAGRKQIGSPGSASVDGIFGPKTHGAIYSELCKHYEQTKAAIHGQVYAKFQEYAGSDPESWKPVLQAYATDRL